MGDQDEELGDLVKGKDRESEKFIWDRLLSKYSKQAIISGIAYCISSCSMILLNKLLLSGYNLNAGISLMFYQNLVSVVIIYGLSSLGVITTEPFTWKLVLTWLPVNLIFVGMLISSMYSLKHMHVAMVTILKNVTNLLIAVGEMYMFKTRHSCKVWGSLLLMVWHTPSSLLS
ncbi:hypothetical protein O6H91_Y359900 [Diphasiastrum complanatum]|nr:hypothetical protein O6H91_Y359900 [Diphasiastrum complanatum]KAJ7282133.1 hypothetical protein O6H91_Y359900 [Diphasiastrum complanatum]KAJ7282134.1 hypothetical protein O6H91_Y359900 [Diphasiastrum complanatum]